MTTPATPNQSATPAAPAAPGPNDPGYAAHMAKLYDAQNPTDPEGQGKPPADPIKTPDEQKTPEVPATPGEQKEPKTDEKPPADPKTDEPKPAAEEAKGFEALLANTVDLSAELSENGGFSQKTIDTLVKGGQMNPLLAADIGEGLALLMNKRMAPLIEAAGSREAYDQTLAWANKNLSADQLQGVNAVLSGPTGAAQIRALAELAGLTKQTAPADPNITVVNGVPTAAVVGYASANEMVAAMADPRYKVDPAYRATVQKRVALMR